jgi:hypothetical protein
VRSHSARWCRSGWAPGGSTLPAHRCAPLIKDKLRPPHPAPARAPAGRGGRASRPPGLGTWNWHQHRASGHGHGHGYCGYRPQPITNNANITTNIAART